MTAGRVLYFVREGDDNEELRYSLRSLCAHLPHEDVVIVGYRPSWVREVRHIPGNRYGSKWLNVYDNLRLACSALGGSFTVMNDDIFLLAPMDRAPSWDRGLLRDHMQKCRGSAWRGSLERTLAALRQHGIMQPVSYEIHAPVEMVAAKLEQVLAPHTQTSNPPQWRTLYGNIHAVPSVTVKDTKLLRSTSNWDRSRPIVSTEDDTWRSHPAGAVIRAMFPDPCRYEA